MGANASLLSADHGGPRPGAKLDDVPESCIALVLSCLDPPEMPVMARVNRAFRAASTADFIWVPKLPTNYDYIRSILHDRGLGNRGKKEIYAALCRPNPFDGGTKMVWIEKRTGGICLAISSRGMKITGIDDRRYWSHIPLDESRFHTVAYLHQIWWVEVAGELEFQFPRGTYSLFFRLQLGFGKACKRLGRWGCHSDNIHGWDVKPVQFSLSTQDGQQSVSRVILDNVGTWVNYHVGDFVVEEPPPNGSTKVKFSLTQIDCTHTKGGLCVDSVYIFSRSVGNEIVLADYR